VTGNGLAGPAASAFSLYLRPWLVIGCYLVVLAVLIILMQNVPLLDPSGFEGRNLGIAMVVAWCAALGVLLLGVIRRHNSRFTLRTLVILTAAIAVYLGLCQALHAVIPTMAVASGLSAVMLFEVQRIGTEATPFRGQHSRIVMAAGGLIFLSHCIRVLGYFMLIQLGLVAMPSR
jgi:hypothetical protein